MLYENVFTIPDLIFTVYDDLQTHHSIGRPTDNSYSGFILIISKERSTYEKCFIIWLKINYIRSVNRNSKPYSRIHDDDARFGRNRKNDFKWKLTEFAMHGLLGDELVTKEFVVGDTYYIMFMRTS